jgi:hypothetical protein
MGEVIVRDMLYELEIIVDMGKTNKKGEIIVSRKGNKVKKLFELNNVELEQYISTKTGLPVKKYSSVILNNQYFKVNKPYEELKSIMQNRSIPVIGLVGYSKRRK